MFSIRPMTLNDHDSVIQLMKATPGITIREADSREATARYLARNPGLSQVAVIGTELVGCIMAGHDGRRGYLQHLVVQTSHRRKGIAAALVRTCVAALANSGIDKCHIDVLQTNPEGAAFWKHFGWTLRSDIKRYSFTQSGNANA